MGEERSSVWWRRCTWSGYLGSGQEHLKQAGDTASSGKHQGCRTEAKDYSRNITICLSSLIMPKHGKADLCFLLLLSPSSHPATPPSIPCKLARNTSSTTCIGNKHRPSYDFAALDQKIQRVGGDRSKSMCVCACNQIRFQEHQKTN